MVIGPGLMGVRREAAGGHSRQRLGLRPVVTLDYNQIDCGMRQAHLDVFLIFRRAIAGERGSIVWKLDDDVAGTGVAFRSVEFAATHQIASAEFFEDRGIGRPVRLEALLVFHIDAPNPITLRHRQSPFFDYGSIKVAYTPCWTQGGGKRRSVTDQRPQSSSASRFTAGAFGFLTLIQSGERPRR